jgi:hypothetical protein
MLSAKAKAGQRQGKAKVGTNPVIETVICVVLSFASVTLPPRSY